MRVVEVYSHLNGLEFLKVHQPSVWAELKAVLKGVDAKACKTKASKEKTMPGKMLYSPIDLNKSIRSGLEARGWKESRVSYWVTHDHKLIRKLYIFRQVSRRQKLKRLAKQRSFHSIKRISLKIALRLKSSSASTHSSPTISLSNTSPFTLVT